MAMFYFIKGLSVFRIVTEPCADCFLLFGGFPISLHHILDVGGFGGREEGLVPFRCEMDNRINGSPEHLACLVENISNKYSECPGLISTHPVTALLSCSSPPLPGSPPC